jgi:Rrf2 family transcriptional regulator, iron-sulfur cluster assembly transcription factor
MFSKTCKYAINAMIYVATLPTEQERVGLKEISKAINSPEAFTGKILQALVRDELLASTKGPKWRLFYRKKSRRNRPLPNCGIDRRRHVIYRLCFGA